MRLFVDIEEVFNCLPCLWTQRASDFLCWYISGDVSQINFWGVRLKLSSFNLSASVFLSHVICGTKTWLDSGILDFDRLEVTLSDGGAVIVVKSVFPAKIKFSSSLIFLQFYYELVPQTHVALSYPVYILYLYFNFPIFRLPAFHPFPITPPNLPFLHEHLYYTPIQLFQKSLKSYSWSSSL